VAQPAALSDVPRVFLNSSCENRLSIPQRYPEVLPAHKDQPAHLLQLLWAWDIRRGVTKGQETLHFVFYLLSDLLTLPTHILAILLDPYFTHLGHARAPVYFDHLIFLLDLGFAGRSYVQTTLFLPQQLAQHVL
jgi:hypothetical protein